MAGGRNGISHAKVELNVFTPADGDNTPHDAQP
jgi:hypothetical protein